MRTRSTETLDVPAMWEKVLADFRKMTPEQQKQTFVDAGILTPKGNVTARYKGVFVPVGKKK